MPKKYITKRISTGVIKKTDTDGNIISYRLTVAQGMRMDGKQIRKTKIYHPLKEWTDKRADKEAIREYGRFYDSCKANVYMDNSIKFSKLYENYKEYHAKNELKEITLQGKDYCINKHIMPVIGNMRLREINTQTFTRLFSDIQKNGNYKKGTLQDIKNNVSSVFSYGLSQGIIDKNPCQSAKLPKGREEKEVKRMIDISDLNDFVNLFQGNDEIDRFVMILLNTGMREGELLGLRWSDIDFDNRTLTINKTLTRTKATGYFLSTPKTKGSCREIYLNDTVVRLFKVQALQEKIKRIAHGGEFLHPEMVFTSRNGNYKNVQTLSNHLKKRTEGTKFENISFHWLRHTNASMLFSFGHSSKEVGYHLGHADTRTTENIYIDLMENSKKQLSFDVENCLENCQQT